MSGQEIPLTMPLSNESASAVDRSSAWTLGSNKLKFLRRTNVTLVHICLFLIYLPSVNTCVSLFFFFFFVALQSFVSVEL